MEATKFTEVGYVGRDVDSIVRDLVQLSIRLVEAEKTETVKEQADALAVEKIVEILRPKRSKITQTAARAAQSAQDEFSELQKRMASMLGIPVSGVTVGAGPTTPPSESPAPDADADKQRTDQDERIRQRLKEQIAAGGRDDDEIEIEVEESGGGGIPARVWHGGRFLRRRGEHGRRIAGNPRLHDAQKEASAAHEHPRGEKGLVGGGGPFAD